MSEAHESSAIAPTAGVGARHARPLVLGNPAQLYRFEDVGAVFAVAQARRVRVVAAQLDDDGEEAETVINLPPGNWLLVSVGAMTGMDRPHVGGIDNPFGVGAVQTPRDDAHADDTDANTDAG